MRESGATKTLDNTAQSEDCKSMLDGQRSNSASSKEIWARTRKRQNDKRFGRGALRRGGNLKITKTAIGFLGGARRTCTQRSRKERTSKRRGQITKKRKRETRLSLEIRQETQKQHLMKTEKIESKKKGESRLSEVRY